MSGKIRDYTDEPIGEIRIVEDFLPRPDALVLREDAVKITLSLSRRSVDFFKAQAAASDVPYQRMIRALVDAYVDRFDPPSGPAKRP